MYKKGELRIGERTDCRTDSEDGSYADVDGAYLPHSCENWVIGGRKEVLALIADLQDALIIFDVKQKPA